MSERGAKAAEVVQVLTAARQTISKRENWMKGEFCNKGHRGGCANDYEISDQFCAIGAVRKANRGLMHLPAEKAISMAVAGTEETFFTPMFNDSPTTGHQDVLAKFDLAIEQQCKIVREEAEKDDSHLPD